VVIPSTATGAARCPATKLVHQNDKNARAAPRAAIMINNLNPSWRPLMENSKSTRRMITPWSGRALRALLGSGNGHDRPVGKPTPGGRRCDCH